jgi:hypothetical protein
MKNKIFIVLTFLASVFILNSCLKDNLGEDWTSSLKGKMYAEVWNAGFQALALQPIPDSVEFKFLVNIATDVPPTSNITLTMWVDTMAVINYNTAKGTNYKTYPYIRIVDKTLTIEKGTRNAYCHVKIWNANLLDACDNYMAPIAIKSATGGVVVADPLNQGARLMGLPIANPWAGAYHCVGYRKHPTAGILPVDKTETMNTVNCHSVIKSGFGDYPYNVLIDVSATTITVLGHACNTLTLTIIDPGTGGVVAGSQQYATFTGDATATPIPPSTDVNYYDPILKIFVLNAAYNASAPRIMYEILTRL